MDKNNIIDSLKNLHDLSKAINSTLNIDEVVEMVLEKTSKLMRSDKILILCLERDENILSVYSSFGFEERELWVNKFYNVSSFDHCIVHKGKVITLSEILPEADHREFLKTMPVLADMLFAPLAVRWQLRWRMPAFTKNRRIPSCIWQKPWQRLSTVVTHTLAVMSGVW